MFGSRNCPPFGGPGQSPWSFGGRAPGGAPQAAAASPSPTPTPTCITPTLFADCFASCAGVLSGASPGPICGWSFIEPFGPLGGQMTLSAGKMSVDTAGATEFPIAAKALTGQLGSVFGLTGRFSFTEYLTAPNANTTYQLVLMNNDLSQGLLVSFFGDGSLVVQAGDPASVPFYTGAWTPTPGAAHEVHFAISALGVPTVYLDGVEIPLTLMGSVPSFLNLFPANSVAWGGGSGDAAAGSSDFSGLFLTSQAVGPSAEFCCP